MILKIIFSSILVWGQASKIDKSTYGQVEANLKSHITKIEDKKKKMKELAAKRDSLTDEAAIRAVLDEMLVEAREMKQSFVKFQKDKKKLNYQFPAKGDETERKYRRFEMETQQEIESLSNLDQMLQHLKQKAKSKYDDPPKPVAKSETTTRTSEMSPQVAPIKKTTTTTLERPVLVQ